MNNPQKYKPEAEKWIRDRMAPETDEEAKKLLADGEQELLEDAFGEDLTFGTGGLRGVMGPGFNRMNTYTVGRATQGLVNYLERQFEGDKIRIAVAYDTRDKSNVYAYHSSKVIASNKHIANLFPIPVPLGLLSYYLREKGCHAGIMITASHNPPQYNGFKVFWNNGGQITAPHDKAIYEEMQKISTIEDITIDEDEICRIKYIAEHYEEQFLENISSLDIIQQNSHKNVKIVYSALHGTGFELIPDILEKLNFKEVYLVDEEMVPQGKFGELSSPNPEEPSSFTRAMQLGHEIDADLLMTTDPDCDRVGVAYQQKAGNFKLLSGNELATLLFDFILSRLSTQEKNLEEYFCVKTYVTSDLPLEIARHYGVPCYETHTGFKNIARVVDQQLSQGKKLAIAAEESYGYMLSGITRDKDAVSAVAVISEMTNYWKDKGKNLGERLVEIYRDYGVYNVNTFAVTFPNGKKRDNVMVILRQNAPETIAGQPLRYIEDYKEGIRIIPDLSRQNHPALSRENMMSFHFAGNNKIFVRPSGTEPKIKFYIHLAQAARPAINVNITERKLQQEQAKLFTHLKELFNQLAG